ncbi:MAG TPA: Rieske (2Fe-2S) protein [Vicinamibacterales bacterium]|nr:Rieske (2Fe-2S) protein [Vicinamibacterales bacterium]
MIPRQAGDAPRDLEHATVAPDGRPLADQPKWRRDFPIDWAQDDYVSRRELVKFVVLTSAALTVGQFWIVIKNAFSRRPAPLAEEPIATVDELSVGGAKTFTYPAGSTPRLLVRTGGAAFVAYDQQCTHLQCPVVPAVAQHRLHCPCHDGWFDLATGRPVAGPPQRPLPRVLVEVRDGMVYATGVEESAS